MRELPTHEELAEADSVGLNRAGWITEYVRRAIADKFALLPALSLYSHEKAVHAKGTEN